MFEFNAPDLSFIGLVVMMVTAVSFAVRRSGLPWHPATAAMLAWLAFTAALTQTGVLTQWEAKPPRLVLLPLTMLAVSVAINRTAALRAMLASTPTHWVIGVQTFRIGVELALFELFREGRIPQQMTFEGRNLDIVVGLTAPFVAWLTARGLSARVRIAWNVAGLLILSNTIVTAATSIPGPLRLDWPGEPLTSVTAWPLVWLPAFLAPLALFLHVFSLRQALAEARRADATMRA